MSVMCRHQTDLPKKIMTDDRQMVKAIRKNPKQQSERPPNSMSGNII